MGGGDSVDLGASQCEMVTLILCHRVTLGASDICHLKGNIISVIISAPGWVKVTPDPSSPLTHVTLLSQCLVKLTLDPKLNEAAQLDTV